MTSKSQNGQSDNLLTWQTQSPEQTQQLGREIGLLVQPSTVIGLDGTLGAGKTKLTQGLVAAAIDSLDTVVVSPTYTICIPYSGRVELLHLDAYRIAEDEEVFELGLDESVDDGAVLVVEWVSKIRDLLPQLDLVLQFEVPSDPVLADQRLVVIQSLTDHGRALLSELVKKLG